MPMIVWGAIPAQVAGSPLCSHGLHTMEDNELRHHIDAAGGHLRAGTRSAILSIAARCWPGGVEDRSNRAALQWVRRWRPERAGAVLPACSCAAGHCAVCN
jgi:hypothetical protein